MSADFDFPPLYDMVTKNPNLPMSDEFRDWLSTFMQTLVEYLKQTGIFLPQLTQAQINLIQNPFNGQMIYNITIASAQYFNSGVWQSF